MSPIPLEPCYFFYRVHQLHPSAALVRNWHPTRYVPNAAGHPYSFLAYPNGPSAANLWQPNQDPLLQQAMLQAALHSGIYPRPRTLYEVVRIPHRLVPHLTETEVCELIYNINEGILLKHCPRVQRYELVDIAITELPRNDPEAALFYKGGAAYFQRLEQLKLDRAAALAREDAQITQQNEITVPPRLNTGAIAPTAPAPTLVQQARRLRTARPRGMTIGETFAYLQRLRKARANNPSQLPPEAPKP